ncbi:tail length tape measure protein [Agrobacterium vitis]|nr:tail length tape measure protein [Agrobacterium vitis]
MAEEQTSFMAVMKGDSSSYQDARRQAADADKRAASAMQDLARTSVALDSTIGRSQNVLKSLASAYVDGAGNAIKFERELNRLSAGISKGQINAQQMSVILDGLYRKFGLTADASRFAAKGQLELATAVEQLNAKLIVQQNIKPANQNLNLSGRINQSLNVQNDFGGANRAADIVAYGSELDKLRAKFDPLFAAMQQYHGVLNEINQAERVGAISASIATEQRLKQANAYGALKNELLQANQSMSLSGRINQSLNVRSDFGGASRSEDIAAYGSELDKLRAKYNPVFATTREYRTELGQIREAYKAGAISADEMAAATSRLRQSTLGTLAALKGQRQGMSDGRQSFAATNLAYQAQDVITQAAMGGVSPAMIALQQGPQAAMSFQGMSARQAISAIGGAAASIVSPLSLATIGITGLLAAGVGYFSSIKSNTKSADDALKEHEASIRRLKDAYGDALKGLDDYSAGSKTFAGLQMSASNRQLSTTTRAEAFKFFDEVGAVRNTRTFGGNTFFADNQFKPFEDALRRLQAGLRSGRPDMEAFYKELDRISNAAPSQEMQKTTDKIVEMIGPVDRLARAMEAANIIKDKLFNDRGPNGFLLSQGTTNSSDMGNLALYESQQKVSMSRTQQALNAQLNGLYARNPDEKAAAARAQASAVYNNDESPAQRRQRIDNAELMARRQAEKELNDAQRDRQMTLAKTLDDQRNEISLIGKTAGEAAALRKEYELISALKMDSARNNRKVDEDEISRIKQQTKELGALTDALNKAKFQDDLAFQQRQLGRNAGDQQIASQLRGAGLPEDLKSGEANQLRSMAQQQAARTQLNSFYSDFVGSLRNNGGDAGKAFGDAFKNALLNSAAKMGEQAMDRIFGWLISGLQSNGGSQASGVGGLVSKGLGLTGGVVANDSGVSIGSLTRMALPEAGKSRTGIPLAQISTAGGLSTSVASAYAPQFQGFVKDLEASGYGIKSIGGYNYRNIAGTNKLSEHAFGKAIDINPLQNPMGKSLVTDMPSNVGDMASKWGLSWGGAWGSKKDAMHFEVANDSASKALERLASSTGSADKGLSTLSSSLMQTGSSLGGKAGGFSGLSSGFDWSRLTSSSFKPNTTYGDFIGATNSQKSSGGGGIFGLLGSLFHFADGTESAPGGIAMVGERGRELVNLPRGSQVIPNHRTESIIAANNNNTGSGFSARQAMPQVNVTIMGNTYSDGHLQSSISSAVQEGFRTQQINNRRGGTGMEYDRWNKDKG